MARILMIEDSELMRRYLARCLSNAGHEVLEWVPESAMEIKDRLLEMKPDLVLTDYFMAGFNGATVARMSLQAMPGLPVLVLTASRDADVAATLAKFKVAGILHKPISAADLTAAVDRALAGAVPPEEGPAEGPAQGPTEGADS